MANKCEAVLNVEDMTVSFCLPSSERIEILQNVSFSIKRGETLGVIGESGAGKSMIGRAIMNALPRSIEVTSGRIFLKSKDITQMTRSVRMSLLGREIAYIPQEPQSALNPVISIGQHFSEHLNRLGHGSRDWRATTVDLLNSVQISNPELVLNKYAHELSGGMCQRILIAMAFAARPTLLIADEATTALDPITQANIIRLLRKLQKEHNTSVFFITHDLRLASHVCDDVLVLFGGQPLEYGRGIDVINNPVHPYTQSLKAAIPSLHGDIVRLPKLPDYLPSLSSFKGSRGCRFAPRSSYREASYDMQNPPPRFVGQNHWVRWADEVPNPLSTARIDITRSLPSLRTAAGLLIVKDIQKRFLRRSGVFSHQQEVIAAKDISFSLAEGEILGIVGLSGSGKSTLAKILVGLERPDAGEIRFQGVDILADDKYIRRKRIAGIQMVFQNSQSSLNPRLTVGSLVTQIYDGILDSISAKDRRNLAASLLRDVGLPADTIDRYPGQLSGGQRQRVGIARALCVQPRIIVADEIVSGLDVSIQAQVLNLLLDIRERTGVSVIFISHDLSVVRYLCDRTAVMQNGAIIEAGVTEQLLQSPKHDYTRALIRAIPPENTTSEWRAIAIA